MNVIIRGVSVLFLLLLSLSCKPGDENPVDNSLSAEAKSALDFHNKARSEVGVQVLVWDEDLAEYAREWAVYLAGEKEVTMVHRSTLGKNTLNAGENIFMGYGKTYVFLDAATLWYNEIDLYTYGAVSSTNYLNTGHYTQMIWKTTQKVGMGMATTKDGATIIVANYLPAGNILGQKPY